MSISRKKVQQIRMFSVLEEVVEQREGRKINGKHWLNTPPEMWDRDEKELHDLVNDIEMKVKEGIFKILDIHESEYR